jgi:hypothetical protein
MENFLLSISPALSLIVSDATLIAKVIFGILFWIFCGWLAWKLLRKKPLVFELHKDRESSRKTWERGAIIFNKESITGKWKQRAIVIGFFTPLFLSAFLVVFLVGQRPSPQKAEIVYIGPYEEKANTTQILGEENARVLQAETANIVLSSEAPASENYTLGSLNVAGEEEVFISPLQSLPLDIYNVSYRVMAEDNGEQTNMLIEWETNKPTKGIVFHRRHSEQDFDETTEDSLNTDHAVLLESLEPETTYVFYVRVVDEWGVEKESQQFAMYSGDKIASLFDLLEEAFGDTFGWAMRKN